MNTWTWQSMVRIFTPSSKVVSPSWQQGASIIQIEHVGFTSVTNTLAQGEILVFSHVP